MAAAPATWQQRPPDTAALAQTGIAWQALATGDVFAGAIVTDAVAGPGGYVAVGYTTDETGAPRVWHSPNGVTWTRLPGELGLPVGFATGLGPAPLSGFPDGAIGDRPLVVAADESGYVLAARQRTGSDAAGQECRARAFLAHSADGLIWSPGGAADLGNQNQQTNPTCGLPPQGAPFIPTDGELTGIQLTGDQVVLFGVHRWARAFATGDTSPAIWIGPRHGDLVRMTAKTDGLSGPTDAALSPGGIPVLGGFDSRQPDAPLVLIAGDGLAFTPTIDGLQVEGRDPAITALASGGRVVVAIGTNEPAFLEPGESEFIAWRSFDGVSWTRDAVLGDIAKTVGLDVVIGPAGPRPSRPPPASSPIRSSSASLTAPGGVSVSPSRMSSQRRSGSSPPTGVPSPSPWSAASWSYLRRVPCPRADRPRDRSGLSRSGSSFPADSSRGSRPASGGGVTLRNPVASHRRRAAGAVP